MLPKYLKRRSIHDAFGEDTTFEHLRTPNVLTSTSCLRSIRLGLREDPLYPDTAVKLHHRHRHRHRHSSAAKQVGHKLPPACPVTAFLISAGESSSFGFLRM